MKRKRKVRRILAFVLVFMLLFTNAFTSITAGSADLFSDGEALNMVVTETTGDAMAVDASDGMFGAGAPSETAELNSPEEITPVYTLNGKVTYTDSAEVPVAIPNIHVYVVDAETNILIKEMLTDTAGEFQVENVSAGTYFIDYVDENEIFNPSEYTLKEATEESAYTVKGGEEGKHYFARIENVEITENELVSLELLKNETVVAEEIPVETPAEESEANEIAVDEVLVEEGIETDVTAVDDTAAISETEETADDSTDTSIEANVEETTETSTEENNGETTETSTEENTDETTEVSTEENTDETTEVSSEENTDDTTDASVENESEETDVTEDVSEEEEEALPKLVASVIEVIKERVNVRTACNVEDETNIAMVVEEGVRFEVLVTVEAEDGIWYQIKSDEQELYIRNDMVQVVEQAPAVQEEENTAEEQPAETDTAENENTEDEATETENPETDPSIENTDPAEDDEQNVETEGTEQNAETEETEQNAETEELAENTEETEQNAGTEESAENSEEEKIKIAVNVEKAVLRTSPSTESEENIQATVELDTEFEVLETAEVTENEETYIWYKISYKEAEEIEAVELYIRSDVVRIVEETEVPEGDTETSEENAEKPEETDETEDENAAEGTEDADAPAEGDEVADETEEGTLGEGEDAAEESEVSETPAEDEDSAEKTEKPEITRIRIIGEDVNLRAEASTEATVLELLAMGTELEVLETVTLEDGSVWYKVKYDDYEGFVIPEMAETVETAEPEEDTETVETAEPEEDTETAEDTEAVEVLEELVEEEVVEIISDEEVTMVEVAVENANIYAEAALDAEILTSLPLGTQLNVLETVEVEFTEITVENETTETFEDGEAAELSDGVTEIEETVAEENEETNVAENEEDDLTVSNTEIWYKVQYEEIVGYVSETDVIAVTEYTEVEEETQAITSLEYEDEKVKVVVTATEAGAIPEGSTLSVTPIEKENAETADQYAEVEQKLQEKAEGEEYDIAGFLAYDICFIDADGNKIEPNGQVSVSMEYIKAEIPEEVKEVLEQQNVTETTTEVSAVADDNGTLLSTYSDVVESEEETVTETTEATTTVTVMHLEEDENGNVENVVDMVEEQQVTALEITFEQEFERAEFVTDTFSVFTITWVYSRYGNEWSRAVINVYYVDEAGTEIEGIELENIALSASDSQEIILDSEKYKKNIDGYTFKNITLDSFDNKISIARLRYNNDSYVPMEYCTSNEGDDWEQWNCGYDYTNYVYSGSIYFVYERNEYATININYVDTSGVDLSIEDKTLSVYSEHDLNEYEEAVEGYRLDKIEILVRGERIEASKIRYQASETEEGKGTVQYSTDGIEWFDWMETSMETPATGQMYVVYQAPYASVNINYVDVNGIDIENINDVVIDIYDEIIELNAIDCKQDILGYEVAKITVDSANGTEVSKIRYSNETQSIQYFSTEWTNWSITNLDSNRQIYVICRPVQISIEDDIIANGNLEVQFENENLQSSIDTLIADAKKVAEESGEEFNQADVVHYVWYKSVNGGEYEEVYQTKVGDVYSTADDGSWLNVVLDDGALGDDQTEVKYKVALFLGDDETPTSVSGEFSIPYYDELRNGSFEIPDYSASTSQVSNSNYAAAGGVWQTTGIGSGDKVGKDIEILDVSNDSNKSAIKGSYAWTPSEDPNAADGVQFAELNCEASGSLYQDVLTVKGENLNYWFSHRARGSKNTTTSENDTMYVVIIPASLAIKGLEGDGNPIDTQEEVTRLISNISSYEGAYVAKYTSDDQEWHNYTGTYTASSYLTRFFFVAGSASEVASGNATVGNFVDYVGFSQKLPPANPGTFTLKLEKTIEGLSASEFNTLKNQLQFSLSVVDSTGAPVESVLDADNSTVQLNGRVIDAADLAWTAESDGSFTAEYTISGKIAADQSYTCTMVETGADLANYTLEKELDISGNKIEKKTDAEGVQSVVIKEKSAATFDFTNSYTLNATKDISFTKVWDDFNNYYNTRPASLDVTLTGKVSINGEERIVETRTVTITADGGWAYSWEDVPVYYVEDGAKYLISWSVTEEDLDNSGTNYDYDQAASGSGNGSSYNTVNNSTNKHFVASYETVEESTIPGNSTTAEEATVYAVSMMSLDDETDLYSTDVAVASEGISTYARPGSSTSSSSTTFSHIDIEAGGSYQFTCGGQEYTLVFDFYNETWELYEGTSATGTPVQSGSVDVQTFKITQIDDATGAETDITVDGSWQSSNVSGQTYEYRISGTFDRNDKFRVHFEIPMTIDGITINLVAEFITTYDDETYNVCAGGGNSKGIDIELDQALGTVLGYSLAITKTFAGLSGSVPETSFEVTGPNGFSKTISFSEFSKTGTYYGSYLLTDLNPGDYIVTETLGSAPDGYTYVKTTVNVNNGDSTEATSITATVPEEEITTVNFTNTYTEQPKTHDLKFTKNWIGGKGATVNESIELKVTYSDGSTETITLTQANGWTYTKNNVSAAISVKSVVETTTLSDYVPSYNYSTDGTQVVVNNIYKSTDSQNTTLTIYKKWAGDEGHEDMRATEVQVALYRSANNGVATQVGDAILLNADNNWTTTFADLPLSQSTTDGEVTTTTTYTYSIEELTHVDGYFSNITTETITGTNTIAYTITNTLDTATLDESYYIANKLNTENVTVNKYWDDNYNEYGSRPTSLSIDLSANGSKIRTITLGTSETNSANKWSATLTLPKLLSSVSYSATETLPTGTNYKQTYYSGPGNIIEFVNAPDTQVIEIEKIWDDGNNAHATRPNLIEVVLKYRTKGSNDSEAWKLYTNENENGVYTLVAESCKDPDDPNYWYYTIDNLPSGYEYLIKENPVAGYVTTYDGTSITNTYGWQMVKVSANDNQDGTKRVLGGAEFQLTNGTTTITGTSGEDGVITWSSPIDDFDGTYTLKETKAPQGYILDATEWTVTFIKGMPTSIVAGDATNTAAIEDNKITFYFENEMLYDLPSTGSTGIFVYLISGVLMMMAAAWIIYKNKCREVLRG